MPITWTFHIDSFCLNSSKAGARNSTTLHTCFAMNVCKVLSCSSDYLLFGTAIDRDAWSETTEKIVNLDIRYKDAADKVIQGFVEAISSAEK